MDKDYRIAKFEGDIVQYLIKKGNLNVKTPFNIRDYKVKIIVRKYLEIYSDTTKTKLLLIRFSTSSDHSSKFWGILSDKAKYFFYDPDDTGEPDLLIFKKKYDPATVATINFYCYQFLPEDFAFMPKASAIYRQNLTIIKDALHNKEGLDIAKVDSATSFFERVTTVKPGSDNGNSGRHHLTQEDYTRWLNWFKQDYLKLYWDKNGQKVKIR